MSRDEIAPDAGPILGGTSTLFDFVHQYMEDAESGGAQSLSVYLRRFPGLEHEVAREFLVLENGHAEGAPGDTNEETERTIGPYRIVRLLASGGQGTVYVAADTRIARHVALKVLHGGWSRLSQAELRRFHREAEVVARLDHPSICPVYEADTEGGVPYIAMQLLEGRTLREVFRDESKGSEPAAGRAFTRARIQRIVEVIRQIADALQAAHAVGIVHRDVKPGNIMITADDRPLLLDFGLARVEDTEDALRTHSTALVGTPTYMSPEVLTEGAHRARAQSDVYALGATLYEWITGHPPFSAPTREALFQAIIGGGATRVSLHCRGASRDLDVVVATALERDPARRYQSAKEFSEELGRLLVGEPIRARPLGTLPRLARWAARRPALAVALSATVLGLAVSLYFWQRAARAVSEYDVVAGAVEVAHLRAAARGLWPALPRRVGEFDAWLEQAGKLAARLPALESLLEELRRSGTKVQGETPGVPPEGAEVVGTDGGELVPARDAFGPGWRFDDVTLQFKHDVLLESVRGLRALVDPDPDRGIVARVTQRRDFARSVVQSTVRRYEREWAGALESIADRRRSPLYEGLSMRPQVGLIPVGRDPRSGLFEFVDLATTDPRLEDPVPTRASDGSFLVGPAHGVVFVLIPGGAFAMGCVRAGAADQPSWAPVDGAAQPMEGPAHRVSLSPFFLSKYELTQTQWRRMTHGNPSFFAEEDRPFDLGHRRANLPVEFITWIDADLWVRRLGWMLPTEAQWEYAARAGTKTPWSTGLQRESLQGACNLAGAEFRTPEGDSRVLHESWTDGFEAPWRVGTGAPNGFGLHDVHGNVWEWCQDDLVVYESSHVRPGDGLRMGPDHRGKVYRGGSWLRDGYWARAAARLYNRADYRRNEIGVRPARAIEP